MSRQISKTEIKQVRISLEFELARLLHASKKRSARRDLLLTEAIAVLGWAVLFMLVICTNSTLVIVIAGLGVLAIMDAEESARKNWRVNKDWLYHTIYAQRQVAELDVESLLTETGELPTSDGITRLALRLRQIEHFGREDNE